MGTTYNEYLSVRLHDKDDPLDVDRIDFELLSETYNFGEIIKGNILIKIPDFSGHR
jgi:hypothetical protein